MKNSILVMVVTFFATNAYAGFVDIPEQPNPFDGVPKVKVVGIGTFLPVEGMGTDVTLTEAIASIVPKGYSVSSTGMDQYMQMRLTWQGGRPWNEVFEDAISQLPGVEAQIDVPARKVSMIVQMGSANTSPVEHSKADTTLAPQGSNVAESIPAPSIPTWDVSPAMGTLKNVLVEWGKRANYDIIWEMPIDFPIKASASFTMPFEKAAEAVIQAFQAAKTAPKGLLHSGNRVLRIIVRGTE